MTVRHPDREIYALFADLGHFAEHLPEDVKEKSSLEFDTDHLLAKVQGFEFGIKVEERVPFTMVNIYVRYHSREF